MLNERVPEKSMPSPIPKAPFPSPLLIGEGMHILNPSFAEAVVKQDEGFLCTRARREIAAGADALAINLGPGKAMFEMTPWVVETIADAVNVPLFLSSGALASKAILEKFHSRITINAVTADTDTLADHLETAAGFGIRLVVLLVRPGLVPAGFNEWLQLASEVIGMAIETGFPLNHLLIDPLITCRPDPLSWEMSRGLPDLGPVLETIGSIQELQQGIKTIAALGNGTIGLSGENRTALHCRMLSLLTVAGADAVILNCLDSQLMQAAGQFRSGTLPVAGGPSHHLLQ